MLTGHMTTGDSRTFVQTRVALFAGLMFWAFGLLVVFVNLLEWVYPQTAVQGSWIITTVASVGTAILGVVWLVSRRERQLTLYGVRSLELVMLVCIGTAFAVNIWFAQERTVNVYSTFIWMSITIFARALIIPSTGRLTAMFSCLVIVPPGVIACFIEVPELPRPGLITGAVLFGGAIVVIGTVGSSVIYGLRRQVREARQLGQYTLGEQIGAGGMGVVYKAKHALLRRPTAIKLLPGGHAGSSSLRRFEREVQLTSQLTHPNTIEIYDYGRSPTGHFYYAMEYLDGIDLDQLIAEFGPMPASRAMHIIAQVCGALGEAHDKGLIHRDIKPSNIILCERGGVADVAKVLDFGLVRDTTEASDTGADLVQGTPAYLAPETIEAPDRVGAATDIYGLGAVAYFLVTGVTVFEGNSLIEICRHHVSTPPVPPSLRAPAAQIPSEVDALILRCLAKKPEERVASAFDLAAQIARLDCSGQWTPEIAARWWHANEPEAKTFAPPEGSEATMTVDFGRR